MKKVYTRPALVVYGQLSELTLGVGGSLPDIDITQNSVVNNNCTLTPAPGFTPVGCLIQPSN
ncbi:MAG TPA: hypothetical protein VNM50_07630 [Chloroflexota bacterium]|nr:hypothetical protein [Chloroflexota bacterium]